MAPASRQRPSAAVAREVAASQQAGSAKIPTHVVLCTRYGYVIAHDDNGAGLTLDTATAYAARYNAERKAGMRTWEVRELARLGWHDLCPACSQCGFHRHAGLCNSLKRQESQ